MLTEYNVILSHVPPFSVLVSFRCFPPSLSLPLSLPRTPDPPAPFLRFASLRGHPPFRRCASIVAPSTAPAITVVVTVAVLAALAVLRICVILILTATGERRKKTSGGEKRGRGGVVGITGVRMN